MSCSRTPYSAKDARNHWPAFMDGQIPSDWEMITWVVMEEVLTRDGEDHRRLRSLIAKAFTARNSEGSRPQIEKIVNTLIEGLA